MQAQRFVAVLFAFIPTALLTMILSHQQLWTVLYVGKEKLPTERIGDQLSELDSSHVPWETLLPQGETGTEDLEAEVAKHGTNMEKMKTEIDICRAEKKTKADELASKERERTETEANLKSESDAWNREIQNLKAQVNGYRPICDYVTDDTRAKELCGTKGEPLA